MSKIDVHHHIYPPEFRQAIDDNGGDPSGWYIPPWTLELDHEICKTVGVKTAILTVTAPGVSVEPDTKKAAKLARSCNHYCAKIRDDEPNAYGFFASIPDILADQEGALAEIDFALDELKADGVILFTRYGEDNHYLGHPDFEKIWAKLHQHKAVVFIHPTHAVDINLVNKHLPQPMIDYPHETGRTALDMICNGITERYSDCKVILSHAGGTLPYLISRAATILPYTPMTINKSTEEIRKAAQWFYFDTAISADPNVLTLLGQFAQPGHILFGTDFPNAPREAIIQFSKNFDNFVADDNSREAWVSGAGVNLFPRLG